MEVSTALIAVFNFGLVFVTFRLVNSTDKLWETAIEESRRAHRAKLAILRIHSPQFISGKPIAVRFDLVNRGLRDAIIVASGSDVFIRPKDPYELRSFDANLKPTITKITLKPGEMSAFESVGVYSLSPETIGKIVSGSADAILIANMQYSDEAGTQMANFFRIYDHGLGCFRRAESVNESQEWEYTD